MAHDLGCHLQLLNEVASGLAARLYHQRNLLASPGSRPNALVNPAFDRVRRVLEKRFPVVPSLEDLTKVLGADAFTAQAEDVARQLTDAYHTLTHVIDFRRRAMQVLARVPQVISPDNVPDMTRYPVLLHGILNLVLSLVKIQLIIAKMPERKLVVGLYNLVYFAKRNKDNEHYDGLSQILDRLGTDPYLAVHRDLVELGDKLPRVIGACLVQLHGTISASADVSVLISRSRFNPSDVPATIALPSVLSDYTGLFTSQRAVTWMVVCSIVCPTALFVSSSSSGGAPLPPSLSGGNSGIVGVLELASSQTLVLPLFRDDTIRVHDSLNDMLSWFVPSSNALQQQFNDLKLRRAINRSAIAAINGAGLAHRQSRAFLRHSLNSLIRLVNDTPGLIGPNAPMLLCALELAKFELVWYFNHLPEVCSPPKTHGGGMLNALTGGGGPTAKYDADSFRESPYTIGELMRLHLQLSGLLKEYAWVVRAYHQEYIVGAHRIALQELLDKLSSAAAVDDVLPAFVPQSLSATLADIELLAEYPMPGPDDKQDMADLQLQAHKEGEKEGEGVMRSFEQLWVRAETALAMHNSSGTNTSTIATQREITTTMRTVCFHAELVDNYAYTLRRFVSLGGLLHHNTVVETHFQACLVESDAAAIAGQPSTCLAFVAYLHDCVNEVHHGMCPEELDHISQQVVLIADKRFADIHDTTFGLLDDVLAQLTRLEGQLEPIQAALRYEKMQARRKKLRKSEGGSNGGGGTRRRTNLGDVNVKGSGETGRKKSKLRSSIASRLPSPARNNVSNRTPASIAPGDTTASEAIPETAEDTDGGNNTNKTTTTQQSASATAGNTDNANAPVKEQQMRRKKKKAGYDPLPGFESRPSYKDFVEELAIAKRSLGALACALGVSARSLGHGVLATNPDELEDSIVVVNKKYAPRELLRTAILGWFARKLQDDALRSKQLIERPSVLLARMLLVADVVRIAGDYAELDHTILIRKGMLGVAGGDDLFPLHICNHEKILNLSKAASQQRMTGSDRGGGSLIETGNESSAAKGSRQSFRASNLWRASSAASMNDGGTLPVVGEAGSFKQQRQQQQQQQHDDGMPAVSEMIASWFARFVDGILCGANADSSGLVFSQHAGGFVRALELEKHVSHSKWQTTIPAENWLDPSELQALATLMGPRGIRVMELHLMSIVSRHAGRVRSLLSDAQGELTQLRHVCMSVDVSVDGGSGSSEILKRAQAVPGMAGLVSALVSIGSALALRESLLVALGHVLQSHAPEVAATTALMQRYRDAAVATAIAANQNKNSGVISTSSQNAAALVAVDAVAMYAGTSVPMDAPRDVVLKALLKPCMSTPEDMNAWELLPFAVAASMCTEPWKRADLIVRLEASANNMHLVAVAAHRLLGSLPVPLATAEKEAKWRHVAAGGAYHQNLALSLLDACATMLLIIKAHERDAVFADFPVRSMFYFLESVVKQSALLTWDDLEVRVPYSLIHASLLDRGLGRVHATSSSMTAVQFSANLEMKARSLAEDVELGTAGVVQPTA